MEEYFKEIADLIALVMELIAVIVIAIGAGQAVLGLLQRSSLAGGPFTWKKTVWLRFGVWLLLGLEFELGADIVRSTVAPTWEQIGRLAAIAVIRTFLNYFLERDIEKAAQGDRGSSQTND
jgi:uncharacterized membrane protein